MDALHTCVVRVCVRVRVCDIMVSFYVIRICCCIDLLHRCHAIDDNVIDDNVIDGNVIDDNVIDGNV